MIVVLGASGNVGGELVDLLCATGHRPRIVVRSEEKARRWQGRVDVVIGDLETAEIRECAFKGADRLFCLSFIEEESELDHAIIDAARAAGIRHVVKLSTIGASTGIPIGQRHLAREEWIKAAGFEWTFLRPNYFMENTIRWVAQIKAAGIVAVPAPNGRMAPIAARDIAEIARLSLVSEDHFGEIYELTGDQLISARQQIAAISRAIDRSIACQEVGIGDALARMRALGRPDWAVQSLELMWTGLSKGEGEQCTSTFADLTGRPPEDFESWCRRRKELFV